MVSGLVPFGLPKDASQVSCVDPGVAFDPSFPWHELRVFLVLPQ